jgi:hypothetical protein
VNPIRRLAVDFAAFGKPARRYAFRALESGRSIDFRMRTSSALAVRVLNGTTHSPPHASIRLPPAPRMPLRTWMWWRLPSRSCLSAMPARIRFPGSNVSCRRPVTNRFFLSVMKKFLSFTEPSLIAPVNGTVTRGWRSKPSSRFSCEYASQIEYVALVQPGFRTPPTIG